jgi:opacity protein-like surface antigen
VKIKVLVAAAALLVAATTGASAQVASSDGPNRWYASLGLGYNWPGNVNSHSTKNAADGKPIDWKWSLGDGAALNASIGYRFTRHFRTELQSGVYLSKLLSVHADGPNIGGFAQNRPEEIWGLCALQSALPKCLPTARQPNNLSYLWSGFINAIYDILPGQQFDPFVGVGGGWQHVEWAGDWQTYVFSGVPGPITPTNPAVQRLKDAGTLIHPNQFAVQFLAGVSYPLAHRFNLDLTYYYNVTPGQPIWNPNNTTKGLPLGAGVRTGDFQGHLSDSSVMASIRYAF